MKDIGEKPFTGKKNTKWYPTITVDADEFSYLKKKKVGEECILVAKVRKVGESMGVGEDKAAHHITLEIRGVEEGKKPKSIREAGHAILEEEYEE